MQRTLDIGLNDLKEQLITMAGYLELAVVYCTQAWKNQDASIASSVYQIEDKVNRAHLEVDATCLKLLATQQPLAFDLRFILSVIKTNTDIERMVDQTVNITRNSEYYLKHPPFFDTSDLSLMSDHVRQMVKNAIDAFVKSDVNLARGVLEADDKVDRLKDKVFKDALAWMKGHSEDIEQGLNVILIARNLERIGDHSTNIAEDVIFSISGKDIRHKSLGQRFQENKK